MDKFREANKDQSKAESKFPKPVLFILANMVLERYSYAGTTGLR